MNALAIVYAVRRLDRAVKIGFTKDLAGRLASLGYENGLVRLTYARPVLLRDASRIEAYAHALLIDHHLGGEWFSVKASAARLALIEASTDGLSIPIEVAEKYRSAWPRRLQFLRKDEAA